MVVLSGIEGVHPSYDFIIAGGGTAGCVLANRLSARADLTVLVIEAGRYLPDDDKINTPGRMVELTGDPVYDWCFRTVPQEYCNGRVIGHSCGRVLGGSSALQYGMCVFPSKASIDSWAELGNAGWNWDSLAPYYRKFHTLQMPSEEIIKRLGLSWIDEDALRPVGPLKVSYPSMDFITPLHEAWPHTFDKLGYKASGDAILGSTVGGYCSPATVDAETKTRSYAAPAYYAPVAERPNLHVLTQTRVEQLRLQRNESNGVKATGVKWSCRGQSHFTAARKEVVVCSGALQSPQILEVSGIGDSKRLHDLGIACFVDNPGVGENLQDHAYARVAFELRDNVPTSPSLDDLIEQYNRSKTGALTSTVICNAYMPLPEYMHASKQPAADRHTLSETIHKYAEHPSSQSQREQYKCLGRILENEADTTIQYRLAPFRANAHMGPAPRHDTPPNELTNFVAISTSLSHPFSRGSVHITSSDTLSKPRLNPNYLSHPLDLEILARHVAFSETIAHTPPLVSLIREGGRRIPATPFSRSLDEAKEMVRESCVSTYHPSSTCSMLPRELGGVVNAGLTVYGTDNVRVCDASIFPLVPRGNIQSTVYAVAERTADLILVDHPPDP